jgi:hypothetical protein
MFQIIIQFLLIHQCLFDLPGVETSAVNLMKRAPQRREEQRWGRGTTGTSSRAFILITFII